MKNLEFTSRARVKYNPQSLFHSYHFFTLGVSFQGREKCVVEISIISTHITGLGGAFEMQNLI